MKTLFLTLLLVLNIQTAWTQEFLINETIIFDRSNDTALTIKSDTFIPNIMGYACPVPAINLEKHSVWNRALNHNLPNFGVRTFALKIKDPNMRFCDWPSATEIFGEEFVVGAEIKLSIRVKRSIGIIVQHDGKEIQVLREVITSELNGKKLISTATVNLSL